MFEKRSIYWAFDSQNDEIENKKRMLLNGTA